MANRGRPTRYSKALVKKICDLIVAGNSLRSICSADEMPHISTVMNWLNESAEKKNNFLEQYTRACKTRSLLQLDEIQDIADDGRNDWMEKNGFEVVNNEAVQRSKLRADARFRIHEIMYPKKYRGEEDNASRPLPRIIAELIPKSDKDYEPQ